MSLSQLTVVGGEVSYIVTHTGGGCDREPLFRGLMMGSRTSSEGRNRYKNERRKMRGRMGMQLFNLPFRHWTEQRYGEGWECSDLHCFSDCMDP